MRRLPLLLPIAAFLAILPLLIHGWPCGKDLPFHLQSWWDAGQQLRQGILYPRWTFAAAFNAGEPRFTFYPPLSWMLGGLLTLILPFAAVAPVFTWLVLTLAGLTMYRWVRTWARPHVAVLAGCVYLANPYMLYTVVMRGACAELLAAAFWPLLFAATLRPRPSPWRIAPALALLWLSNVPGAILGTYLFALLAVLQLVQIWRGSANLPRRAQLSRVFAAFVSFVAGLGLGLSLAGSYLVPALIERHFIVMEDAFPKGMRPIDNLLLAHRVDPLREALLLHMGYLAASMGAATLLLLASSRLLHRPSAADSTQRSSPTPLLPVLLTSLFVLLLTTQASASLWRSLPALGVAQLPWRVLFVLGSCMAASVALVAQKLRLQPLPALGIALVALLALAMPIDRAFARPWPAGASASALAADLSRHHPPAATEEYVVQGADTEYMRPDNPPFWLAQDPQGFAPGTTPNPMHDDPRALMPAAPAIARLQATPLYLSVSSPVPTYLILNLQRFPRWSARRNGVPLLSLQSRPDGLMAFRLPAGRSEVSLIWRHAWDEWVGALLTIGALLALLLHSRRVTPLSQRVSNDLH